MREPEGASFGLLLFGAALLGARWAWDLFRAHPGVGAPEELLLLNLLQNAAEGHWPAPFFGSGALSFIPQALAVRLFPGSLAALHLPSLILVFTESALLLVLGVRLLGKRAGLAAALLNFAFAFSFLRSRTLFPYVAQPTALLALLVAIPAARGKWRSFFWGLACGLPAFDYQGWLPALGILGVATLAAPREERPALPPVILGACLSLGAAAWLYGDGWQHSMRYHSQASGGAWWTTLATQCRSYFLGNPGHTGGLGHAAVFPWPGLSLAVLGTWALPRAIRFPMFVWLALGLAPLALANPFLEANRAILAWPALCLLAGAGWGFLAERANLGRGSWFGLAALFLGIFAWQHRVYSREAEAWGPPVYTQSQLQLEAVKFLDQESPGKRVVTLTELGGFSKASFRFFLGRTRHDSGPVWALIPPSYENAARALGGGRWVRFKQADSGETLILLQPNPILAERLREVDKQVREARALAPVQIRRGVDYWRLTLERPGLDPWTRCALMENLITCEASAGMLRPRSLELADDPDFPSAQPLLHCADSLAEGNPALALHLRQRAAALAASWAKRARTTGRPS